MKMKYSRIVEINQLLETEEILKMYQRLETSDKLKQRALDLAVERWQVIPKASEDGWQHPQMSHLKIVLR